MAFDADSFYEQIPYYLTSDPQRKAFINELKALCQGATKSGYYISSAWDPNRDSVLQGDGWRGFVVFAFSSGESRSVKGIAFSNTCDVSPDNERVFPPKITFAPIIKLSRLRERFNQRNLDSEQIESRIQAIMSQKSTSVFYLPAGGGLDEDYVALLDDVHSMPMSEFEKGREKIFTLSMAGFYLFVFKLSIHFCRLHENLERSPLASEGTS